MANEVASSHLVDPFANCSLLSLFPRTFGASADHRHASKDTDTIDSRHTLLKSMVLRSPQKLVEQAKMVLNSKLPELPQRNIIHDGADAAAAEKIVRGRRPGLGIKRDRPRFSFVPSSQDTVRSETTDFDKLAMELEKLDDPEEYFLAHKRLEIAKKEYERLGSDGGSKQSLPPTAPLPRQRRPGLLGSRRATGRFKQFFSQSRPENDEAFISSQEIASQEISSQEMLSQDVPSSFNNISDGASFEREFSGSGPVSRTEDKVNKLLNEFLSKNPAELEGYKAIALLHKRLQIKPISTDKRSLPDMPDILMPDLHDIRNDFKVSGGNLFNPRNLLVNAHAKLKGMSIPTPMKQRDSTVCKADFTDSPTPPRNPFEAISSLKRRISQISHSPVRNPSLVGSTHIHSDKVEMEKIISPNLESQSSPSIEQALEIATDLSLARNPSPVRSIHFISDKVELEKNFISSNLESLLQAYVSTDCTTGSGEVLADYSTSPVDKYVNEYSSSSGFGKDDHSSKFDVCVDATPGCSNEDEMIVDDETRLFSSHSNKLTDPRCEVDNSTGRILEDPVAPAQPVTHSEHLLLDQLSNSSHKSDPQNPGSVEQIAKNANSKNSDANLKQPIENIHERSGALIDQNLGVTHPPQNVDVPSKPATCTNKGRKRKEITRRQSLAAAGTKWESGLRRSTRIKIRPLEYWKGERFLYGRIHSSLATVIGVKYSSPAAGDKKCSLKVKSYVSDEYKELVDLAALH